METEKLQKVLARAGMGSRREMERWIQEGRIKVNNRVATLGLRVNSQDIIKVNNRIIKKHLAAASHNQEVILYHKPVGEICTRKDNKNRKTVFDNLPKPKQGRWISVGRLDIQTSGLMIFTTDGELANKMMHPSSQIDREYAVRVFGEATNEQLKQLRAGIELEDGVSQFEDIVAAGGEGRNRWYHVVLKQGKNREVRRLWEAVDLPVSRLIRVRYGPFELSKLIQRRSRYLDYKDKKFLMQYLSQCQTDQNPL